MVDPEKDTIPEEDELEYCEWLLNNKLDDNV